VSYDAKRTRERIAQQIARYVRSTDELRAMAEVRKECGITEEEVYQSLCAARDKALRDSQEDIFNNKYGNWEKDEDGKVENLLRIKLSAYNILQNAVERYESIHKIEPDKGLDRTDADTIGYELPLPVPVLDSESDSDTDSDEGPEL
jgi:hypothetical protein